MIYKIHLTELHFSMVLLKWFVQWEPLNWKSIFLFKILFLLNALCLILYQNFLIYKFYNGLELLKKLEGNSFWRILPPTSLEPIPWNTPKLEGNSFWRILPLSSLEPIPWNTPTPKIFRLDTFSLLPSVAHHFSETAHHVIISFGTHV